MFERRRQKNFFKHTREEFLLDALVDYHIEPEDPTRTIPNPERRALDKEIRAARADVARLERNGCHRREQCRTAPANHAGEFNQRAVVKLATDRRRLPAPTTQPMCPP